LLIEKQFKNFSVCLITFLAPKRDNANKKLWVTFDKNKKRKNKALNETKKRRILGKNRDVILSY